MKLLYDTINNKLLPWPRTDEEPVIGLSPNLLEMTVIQENKPQFDPETQTIQKTEIIDVNARTVTKGWNIITFEVSSNTAEEWVSQYFTNLEVIALMRLEQAILSQGKTLGPKMEASKQWLESMMFAQPSSNFPAAPFSYAETSAEAAQTLST